MAFTMKVLKQIVDDMISTVRATATKLTDYNRGSVVRTTIEATALQLADLYLQLSKLKEIFSIDTAIGSDLDGRAEDYDITRSPAANSVGYIVVGDSTVTKKVATVTTAQVDPTSTYIVLGAFSSGVIADLPSVGTVILERDTPSQRENIDYSSVDVPNHRLVISSTVVKTHLIGSTVILSRFGSDKTISNGTKVRVQATTTTKMLEFSTQVAAVFVDGEGYSPSILTSASFPGSAGNVADSTITAFSSLPWPTATVSNSSSFSGGADIETDFSFRGRIKTAVQTMTRGTIRAVQNAPIGVQSGVSKVIYSKVIEDVLANEVRVYINDGSLSAPLPTAKTVPEIIIFDAVVGQRRGRVLNWPVDGDLNLWKSMDRGVSTLVTPGAGTAVVYDGTKAWGTNALATYVFVDPNRNIYNIVSNTSNTLTVTVPSLYGLVNPVVGDYAISPVTNASFRLVRGTHYYFNETNGDVEFVAGLVAHDTLMAYPALSLPAYSYFTGIIQEVQKVVNSDPSNFTTYPGIKAAGIKTRILWPDIVTVYFVLSITAVQNVSESTLYPLVAAAIEQYVNSLDISESVVLSEVVAAAMSISGVADVRITQPSDNVLLLENQLARTSSSNMVIS